MTGIIFKSYKEYKLEEAYETGIYGLGEMAVADYNELAENNEYGKLGKCDHLFGCIAENDDAQEDIDALIASAVLNPYISIIMIQYPENNSNIDWNRIETYLEKHNFTNLHSYDQRLTYGRFVPRLAYDRFIK